MAANRSKVAARERARQRRLELDAERARRDERIEVAASEFFHAQDFYRAAAARMSAAVADLESFGESSQRIQALLDVSGAELRRIRRVVEPAAGAEVGRGARAARPRHGQSESSDRGGVGVQMGTSGRPV